MWAGQAAIRRGTIRKMRRTMMHRTLAMLVWTPRMLAPAHTAAEAESSRRNFRSEAPKTP
jgi:hypothetical protein